MHRRTKNEPVRTVGLAELGLDDVRPATAVLTAVPRPPRAPGTISSDTGDGGARLAAFLRERLA